MESKTYAEAVADFLKKYRKDHGLTLDAVARAGRDYGAKWGIASIRNIEAAKASPTIPTLLTLALALEALTEKPLRLKDLLGDAEALDAPTWMPKAYPVKRAWVDSVLDGGEIDLMAKDLVGALNKDASQQIFDALKILDSIKKLPLPPVQHGGKMSQVMKFSDRQHSLAEQRAAAKLGTSPVILRAWADHLWGAPLEEESNRRAELRAQESGKAVTPQGRGAVTRDLIEELRTALNEIQEGQDGSPA